MMHGLASLGWTLAQVSDGVTAWSQFVRSAGRALASNQAIAPLVGLGILTLLLLLADWKFAGWLERLWRRHHAPPAPAAAPAGRGAGHRPHG